MTEKIDWYQEVMELEPNSKVFFPLARLLVEAGRNDEAVETLDVGLARHPEFLEARLFYIELLYKSGRRTACTDQVGRLSKMFSEYSGFWQAWAACLSSVDSSSETAAVLRFLAANFAHGPISLQEALNRGLSAMLEEPAPAKDVAKPLAASVAAAPAPTPASVAPVTAPVAVSVVAPRPAATSSVRVVVGSTTHTSVAVKPAVTVVPPAELQDFVQADSDAGPMPPLQEDDRPAVTPGSGDEPAFTSELFETDEAKTNLAENQGDAALTGADLLQPGVHQHENPDAFDPAAAMADDEPLPEAPSMPLDVTAGDEDLLVRPPAGVDHATAMQDEADDNEERFSLRTRSMAEVLAEQGDVQGALDIYHELAAASVSREEDSDLQQRIATLSSRLSSAQNASEQTPSAEQPESSSGKDKLISMLEALAERVEARAQG